ncbi:hypothetical protein J1N35_037511, partial [Gossypium stocksii]
DSYAGEWCDGQSHGVGVQTSADWEFKSGLNMYLATTISVMEITSWLFLFQ